MDAQTIAVIGLCVTVAAHGAVMLFKSPKEFHRDLVQRVAENQADTNRRITDLEARHTNLSMRFEGAHGKHDQALSTLTQAINRLTERFDAYMGERNGRGHRSG